MFSRSSRRGFPGSCVGGICAAIRSLRILTARRCPARRLSLRVTERPLAVVSQQPLRTPDVTRQVFHGLALLSAFCYYAPFPKRRKQAVPKLNKIRAGLHRLSVERRSVRLCINRWVLSIFRQFESDLDFAARSAVNPRDRERVAPLIHLNAAGLRYVHVAPSNGVPFGRLHHPASCLSVSIFRTNPNVQWMPIWSLTRLSLRGRPSDYKLMGPAKIHDHPLGGSNRHKSSWRVDPMTTAPNRLRRVVVQGERLVTAEYCRWTDGDTVAHRHRLPGHGEICRVPQPPDDCNGDPLGGV